MKKVLVILGHPDLEKSIANSSIIKKLREIKWVTINNLVEKYPDYKIDIEEEQKLLLEHDIIVFQFPFFWYSVPWIIKKWFDDVYTYGFAYGSTWDKLKWKEVIVSTTTWWWKESYNPLSFNHFPMEELLKPLQQTAYLTQMRWNTPIITHSMVYIPWVYHTKNDILERSLEHFEKLSKKIESLRNKTPLIENFIKKWFKKLDILEENPFFLAHLEDDTDINILWKKFVWKDWFNSFYEEKKGEMKVNSRHKISDIKIKNIDEKKDIFEVIFKVNLEWKNIRNDNISDFLEHNWEIEIWEYDMIKIKKYHSKKI